MAVDERKGSKKGYQHGKSHINIHSMEILPYLACFVFAISKWEQKTLTIILLSHTKVWGDLLPAYTLPGILSILIRLCNCYNY